MTRLLLALTLLLPAGAQEIYDLVLKNGTVIDPANRRNGRMDVAVIGNTIARVAPGLPAAHGRVVIECGGYTVVPGLIDLLTHFDDLQPDHNTLPSGVTTAVAEALKQSPVDRAKTRMLAFLNIGEMNPETAARMVRKYPEIIVGIKAGGDAVDRAIKASELSGTLVMADSHPELLRPGDIFMHVYGRLTPQFDAAKQARRRGVLFNVGSFWFRIAVPAIREGFLPDTLSTDIDKESILLPRANMITTLSKFLNLGMTLEQAIQRVTVNAARAIRRPELGTLGEGAAADIAVLEVEQGRFAFLDSGHGKLVGDRRLRCVLTIRNGAVVWDSDGLSAPDWIRAGPYSNFK